MKKLFVITLALAMILAMATTAFAAATTITLPYEATKEVTVNYTPGDDVEHTYGVVITWGAIAFGYTGADGGTWSPESHTYTGGDEAGWDAGNSASVTVENHSDLPISVAVTYAKGEYTGNLGCTVTDGTADLDEWGGETTSMTATYTITGTPTNDNDGVIGSITVAISTPAA